MSIELTTKNTGIEKVLYDGFCEQSVDSDVTLPDYCPDIMRILKCTVHTSVTNSKIAGDRAIADGNAKIRIIYADEKNSICCYDTDYPFSKYAELTSPVDSAALICTAKCDYVNCRAVSKRRLDIHGVISVHFKVLCGSENTVISDADGSGIQLKRKGIDTSSVSAVASKLFQLSEVQNVGDGNDGIGKILCADAAPVVNETKLIKGKILIKGELCVRVLYCSDTNPDESIQLCCSIPFNEIAESPDFKDTCTADTEITVLSLTAEPKTDNDGEYRYMNINAELCAKATAYEPVSISIITDAYSTQNEIDAKYSIIDFCSIQQKFTDTVLCRQSIDLSAIEPEKLFVCITSSPDYKYSFTDSTFTLKGKIPLCLIVIGKDGIPVSCEREAEFEYTKTIDIQAPNLICKPEISLTGYSCLLSGSSSADFKAELNISALIMSNTKEKALTSLSVSERDTKKARKPSLTIYFCSGNESVWDIARRYNTTVEEIMDENGLTADYLESKTMLMIPIK